MNLLIKILAWIGGLLAAFVLFAATVGWVISEPGYEGPESDHFDGDRFRNLAEVPSKSFIDVFKWYVFREPGQWREVPENEVHYGDKPAAQITDSLSITYINHSTFLIQVDGLNILTDPTWSDRASPFNFAGPKRFRPPGIKFDDLPDIDAVLISHNHYDHLNISTLKKINDRFAPLFVVPLGVDLLLNKEGIENTRELDWWQSEGLNEKVEVNAVPAQHFSARGLFDRDKTLWAGFVLKTNAGNIYFAGDTGYGDFFKEINKRFGTIKMGLIPIGAYKPRWFMKPMHVNPAEAIQAHKDLKAEISFGMHFGTFPLADDGQDDPVNDFTRAMREPSNAGVNFKLLREGDRFVFHVE